MSRLRKKAVRGKKSPIKSRIYLSAYRVGEHAAYAARRISDVNSLLSYARA